MRLIIAGANDVNDLVDIVAGNGQTLKDVSALLSLAQVIAGTPFDDLVLELNVIIQHVAQRQNARLAVNQRKHVGRKGLLHLGVLKQTV